MIITATIEIKVRIADSAKTKQIAHDLNAPWDTEEEEDRGMGAEQALEDCINKHIPGCWDLKDVELREETKQDKHVNTNWMKW